MSHHQSFTPQNNNFDLITIPWNWRNNTRVFLDNDFTTVVFHAKQIIVVRLTNVI